MWCHAALGMLALYVCGVCGATRSQLGDMLSPITTLPVPHLVDAKEWACPVCGDYLLTHTQAQLEACRDATRPPVTSAADSRILDGRRAIALGGLKTDQESDR